MMLGSLKTASPHKKSQYAFFGAAIITLMVLGAWGVTLGDRLAATSEALSVDNAERQEGSSLSFFETIDAQWGSITESFSSFGDGLDLLTGSAEGELDTNAFFETAPAETDVETQAEAGASVDAE